MATTEQLIAMDRYREKYESITGRKISQSNFTSDTTHLPTWEYLNFLEGALYQLEKKNIELKNNR